MVEKYGLLKVTIPEDDDLEEEYRELPRSYIFMTEDVLKQSDQNDD